MQNDLLLDLIKKYRRGEASPDEIRLVEAYYQSFESKQDTTSTMTEAERLVLSEEIRQGISTRPREIRRQPRWMGLWKYAAAMLILAVGLFYLNRQETPVKIATTPERKTSRPANNFVQLPDGSTAILSPGSKLDYPKVFNVRGNREVHLHGEAFFSVKSDPKRPFIVYTGKIKTAVLGTTFNVRAVPGDPSITITVTSGKVQVADGKKVFEVLLPDERMVYYLEESKSTVETVDAKASVSWKLGDLFCDDITVAQAALHIQEKYDIKIEITDEGLKNKRFTTTFGKDEALESVLNSLALFNDAEYRLDSQQKKAKLFPKADPT